MFDWLSSGEAFVGRKKKKNKKIKKRDGIKAGSEIKQSPWGELQDDLLIEINRRLLLSSDHIRFNTVCKNWLAVDQNKPQLPWIINTRYHQRGRAILLFELHEPSSSSSNFTREPTFVYKVNLLEYGINPTSFLGICNTVHRHGWIFFCATDQQWHTYFLLFSPFTKNTIKLLYKSKWGMPSVNTFSADPNSRDCVFLLLYRDRKSSDSKTTTVRTFCDKYKIWTSTQFDTPQNFERCGQFPVYIKGIFYFVFPIGKLASFNVDRLEWRVESVIGCDIFPKDSLMEDIYEAFELNGELVLVCIQWDDSGFIARFDWSKKAWVPLESLGNNSLFCTEKSILVSPIGREERNRGVLPNKIYYARPECFFSSCIVYSLESGKLTKFTNKFKIRSWDKVCAAYCSHWFEPPHPAKKKPSAGFLEKE